MSDTIRRRSFFAANSKLNVNDYLTIEALEDKLTVKLSINKCEYCVDGDGDWKTLNANTATPSINTGHIISFRAALTPNSSDGIGTFTVSKKYNLLGNVMSMVYGDNTSNNNEILSPYQFFKLFYNNTTLQSVSKDFLPATVLKDHCYDQMFSTCSALANVPDLPATTLSPCCYYLMFYGCSSLIAAPTLPATTLSSSCYYGMFYGCSSLTTTPALPATTLSSSCYYGMFRECTSLTAAPNLPATSLADSCYYLMFYGCSKLSSGPSTLPATVLKPYCYYGMFNRTVLKTAPTLPATTLATDCYRGMFAYDTALTTAPALPATTTVAGCYWSMFQNCTSLTTASKISGTTLTEDCYRSMFAGCSKLTSAPTLPATTLAARCYYWMFGSCTSLTTAPALPATTLVTDCYKEMFHNCTKLNYVKALFTTEPSTSYTSNWLYGVAATGTFVKNTSATWDVVGANGIPEGWTIKDPNGNNLGTAIIKSCVVDLNKNWAVGTSTSDYGDKVFESSSNYNQNSTHAYTYITFKGYDTFTLYIRSYAESNYDYVMVSQLDTTITGDTSYSSSSIKAHTRGNQQSGNKRSNYTAVTFTGIDKDEHTITIVYRKDSSQHSGTDKGYFFINPDTKYSVINVAPPPPEYYYGSLYNYLCIEAIDDLSINLYSISTNVSNLRYSSGNGYWYAPDPNGDYCTVDAGDVIYLKGECNPGSSVGILEIYGRFNLSGNCNSLLFGHDAAYEYDITNYSYAFNYLFYGTSVVNVSSDFLPATYLGYGCYSGMFEYCASLVTAPELPATTLAANCYSYMFESCASLVTAPELPATTLVDSCYYWMFAYCSKLNYIKVMAENPNSSYVYGWVYGVASSGTFVQNSSADWSKLSYGNGIPSGWSVSYA